MFIERSFAIKSIIATALKEDIGKKDITTDYLVSKDHISEAHIVLKEEAVVCGVDLSKQVFKYLDPKIKFQVHCKDGQKVKKETRVATLRGKTRVILTGERTALNFLAHLSGIATNTAQYVDLVKPLKTQILDTRKTTPGLRKLEKYAVRCGGGDNHRVNLNDMILIKDNHKEAYSPHLSCAEIIKYLRKRTKKKIIIEVDTLKQFKECMKAHPDVILLDNMNVNQLKKAVLETKKIKGKKPLLEASGGITLRTVKSIAETGIDRISIGSLTHTHKAINFSMEVIN